nr:MAG TPA: hypothetical protein [Caudoviricetes sp.]
MRMVMAHNKQTLYCCSSAHQEPNLRQYPFCLRLWNRPQKRIVEKMLC